MTSAKLQSIRQNNAYENHLQSQYDIQNSFFQSTNVRNRCMWNGDRQFHRELVNISEFKIEINMINSSLFSSLEEDKGLHYLSPGSIAKLRTPSQADFVITLMHHAPEWFCDDIKHQLENAIYGKSSLVFFGHEHYIEQKKISHENAPYALIQAGGELCNNEDWTKSAFYVGILDTSDLSYTQYEYIWNIHEGQYEHKGDYPFSLVSKPSVEQSIAISEEFKTKFYRDAKHDHLAKDFREYFVFPRIQEQNGEGDVQREFTAESEFIQEILQRKRILIYGGYNSGKSVLLKALFSYFASDKNFFPVFCGVDNIHGTNTERMIHNSFQDTYGNSSSDYERFLQIPKEKKIVFVDDADQISRECFDLFIRDMADRFEYIIIASKQYLELNLLDRAKSILEVEDSMHRYSILPFYQDKRVELIRKVVSLKSTDMTTVENITNVLTESLASKRRSIILEPDFIINYAEYFYNNIGEISSSDSSVFSKVFEANITNSLSPNCTGSISVDKVYVVLSKIAYHIHFNKKYPIPHDELVGIINQYNDEYDANVSPKDLIEIVCKSRIMLREEKDNAEIVYRFSTRNYLAYFVAREINSIYNATRNTDDLFKVLKCACFGINADILLFLSYITDNTQIINAFMKMAVELTNEWEEFDYKTNAPAYLSAISYDQISPPNAGDLEKEQQRALQAERKEVESLRITNIYDYSDEAAEEMANQIIRACSLLIVISKCLPGFEHNMKKSEKEVLVDLIYKLPNRIFGKWASITDSMITEIVDYFQQQGQDYYQQNMKVSGDVILKALQQASVAMLLDMYNMSAYYSVRHNSLRYLSSYNYKSKASYSVEHLMMLERAGKGSDFTDEAMELIEKSTTDALSVSITYIVKHALTFRPEFQSNQIDRLSTKFFNSKESRKKLLSQRYLRSGSHKKE